MRNAPLYAVLIINRVNPDASQVHCVSPDRAIAEGIAATLERISLDSYLVRVESVQLRTREQHAVLRARGLHGSQAEALEARADVARLSA